MSKTLLREEKLWAECGKPTMGYVFMLYFLGSIAGGLPLNGNAAANPSVVGMKKVCENYHKIVASVCQGNVAKEQMIGGVVNTGKSAAEGAAIPGAAATSSSLSTIVGGYNLNNSKLCANEINACTTRCEKEIYEYKNTEPVTEPVTEPTKAQLQEYSSECSEYWIYAAASGMQGVSNMASGAAAGATGDAASSDGGRPELPGSGGVEDNTFDGGDGIFKPGDDNPDDFVNNGDSDGTSFDPVTGRKTGLDGSSVAGANGGFNAEAVEACLDPAEASLPTCFSTVNSYCATNGDKSVCKEFCKQNFTAGACQGRNRIKRKRRAGFGGGAGGGGSGGAGGSGGIAGAEPDAKKSLVVTKRRKKKDPFGGYQETGGGSGGGYESSYVSPRMRRLNLKQFGLGQKKKSGKRGAGGVGRSLSSLDASITGPLGVSLWQKVSNRYVNFCKREKFITCRR